MIKKVLGAVGFGLAFYVGLRSWQGNTGISTAAGEGDLLATSWGDLQGGFMTVSNFGGLNMNISINGLAYIKGWEKLKLNRYLDSGGRATIGYGHLIKSFESYSTITEMQATGLLMQDLSIAIDAVNKGVKAKITQSQFDAFVSFAFNVGAGGFLGSTMLKLFNNGDIAGAKLQFGAWVYVKKNGVKVIDKGLINRRAGDAKLFGGVA